MAQKIIFAGCVGVAAAGSLELSSSNLMGDGKVLENIKGKWGATLKFLGADANLEVEYDRNENEGFLKDATVSGKVDDVSYEVKSTFGGDTELSLSADTKDGTTVSAEANLNGGVSVTKVSASRGTTVRGQDVDVEASHTPGDGESKLKLSSVLGHGVTAIATLTGASGKGGYDTSTEYELEYEGEVAGRKLTANINPSDGSGEVEIEDSSSIDATITATLPLGGSPTVSVKRSWGF